MRIGGAGRMALGILVLAVLGTLGFLFRGLFDPNRLPPSDWRLFQKRFITADGRVVDTGNGNVSHSEGQGYAMLFAIAYRDRGAFERIWTWTRKNLQTRPGDKLLSWQWRPDDQGGGAVTDPNNASDGDLLVAWALLRAFRLWENFEHQQAALQILADLARLDVLEGPDGPVLLPGTDGFVKPDGTTLNPSYYVFPALREVAEAVPGGPWKDLAKSGLALLAQARFGDWQLTPDWILDGDPVTPAPGFPPLFGYNAIRIPLHLGWQDPRSDLMQPFAQFWRKCREKNTFPATVDVVTNAWGSDPALPGMRAVADFAVACAEKQSLTVRSLPVLTEEEAYYSASLNLLTKLAIRELSAHP